MKRMIIRLSVVGMAVVGLSLAAGTAVANNVAVTNTHLASPGPGTVKVAFDLAWDNSWRDGVNHDACWVFVKYSTDSGTNWSHATLGGSGTNPPGFSPGANTNLEIIVPADKKGAFIQRSVPGTGTVSSADVRLVWDFKTNGVSASASARVKVFAVEMVYVPEGSFYAGDGTTNTIRGQFENGTSTNPLLIASEGQLTLGGGGAGSLGNNNKTGMYPPTDDFNDTISQTLPATFPKGFAALYLMKTEISQRQYCDFLNTLTTTQQGNRHDSALHFNVSRNFIKKTSGSPAFFGCDANNNAGPATAVTNVALLNETNDAEWVACSYLSWMDGAAYADWAALRPMTELEFEKACRGTLPAVTNECAWGNTNLETATSSLINSNTASETPNQGNCNYVGCSPDGPYRVGSYAGASSSRQNAGAGYYGALDLSGSLWEQPVTVGNATGRGFTGTHGDGSLSTDGHANAANWPGLSGGEVTGSTGAGFRGGYWGYPSDSARVSERYFAACADPVRNDGYVWRGARTAPYSIAAQGGQHDAYHYGGTEDSYTLDEMSYDKFLLRSGTIFIIR